VAQLERVAHALDDPPAAGVHDPVLDGCRLPGGGLEGVADERPQAGPGELRERAREMQVAVVLLEGEADGVERAADVMHLRGGDHGTASASVATQQSGGAAVAEDRRANGL